MPRLIRVKGGPGSGHHGHAGRPGSVGGSASGTGGIESLDESAVAAYGDREWANWYDELSQEQGDMLALYGFTYDGTGLTGEAMNHRLRHPDEAPMHDQSETDNAVDVIRNSMIPISGDIMVHRTFGSDLNDKFAAMGIGETFTDLGFTSTSLARWEDFDQRVMMRVPKGTKAAYLSIFSDEINRPPLSEFGYESFELLLQDGLTYRKVGMSGDTTILEVVSHD